MNIQTFTQSNPMQALNKRLKAFAIDKQATPEIIAEMREFLTLCTFADMEPDEIDELSRAEIIKAINRHYEGGAEQFIKDNKQ